MTPKWFTELGNKIEFQMAPGWWEYMEIIDDCVHYHRIHKIKTCKLSEFAWDKLDPTRFRSAL